MLTLSAQQLAAITAVGAALIPPLTSLLKRETWPTWVKQLIALLASAAVAVIGIAITTTDWTTVNFVTLAALAFTGSQVVYQAWFRGSVSDSTLTAAPKKTTPAPPVPPQPVVVSPPTVV